MQSGLKLDHNRAGLSSKPDMCTFRLYHLYHVPTQLCLCPAAKPMSRWEASALQRGMPQSCNPQATQPDCQDHISLHKKHTCGGCLHAPALKSAGVVSDFHRCHSRRALLPAPAPTPARATALKTEGKSRALCRAARARGRRPALLVLQRLLVTAALALGCIGPNPTLTHNWGYGCSSGCW